MKITFPSVWYFLVALFLVVPAPAAEKLAAYQSLIDQPYTETQRARPSVLLCGQTPAQLKAKSLLPEWAGLRTALLEDAICRIIAPGTAGR
jgi:hypothetical protein